MKSNWYHLKERAVELRLAAYSIRDIQNNLGIPRSTLSNWLKNVEISSRHKENLDRRWKKALLSARKKAVIWHNNQKAERLATAKQDAKSVLHSIETTDTNVLELALAILYLAEGSKKNTETALGSSDWRTLLFFITAVRKIYNFDVSRIRCELYLRADQDTQSTKEYWSEKLKLPLSNFKHVHIDTRTKGTRTYPEYKGVCSLRCGNVAIQRKLVYLAEEYFNTIIEQH